jgi:hypothetical protein
MHLTKNLSADFAELDISFKKFLTDLRYEKLNFRMILAEISFSDGAQGQLAYYDSATKAFKKDALTDKKLAVDTAKILSLFSLDPETTMIECFLPDGDGPSETRKQCFYIIFEFSEKIKMILFDFVKCYQATIMRYFYNKGRLEMPQIINAQKNALSEAIKMYIDLDIINTLSASQYERRELGGSIIYVKNRSEASYKIKFNHAIQFNTDNLRLIRKLLEMSDRTLSLVVTEKGITGLGTKDSPFRKIQFNGNQSWTLNISSKEALRSNRGKYFFEKGYSQIVSNLPKNFILKKHEKIFNDLVNILSKQKHGALLIVSDDAEAEVRRLSSLDRGYGITPINFNVPINIGLIRNLSYVDGAVFIDRQLNCYGAGLILDGIAKRPGSNARGSRYNSARCYLDNETDCECVAIVFSEDETIDVIKNK